MVDPILTGLMVSENTLSGGKSVVKAYPEERVGVFCKKMVNQVLLNTQKFLRNYLKH